MIKLLTRTILTSQNHQISNKPSCWHYLPSSQLIKISNFLRIMYRKFEGFVNKRSDIILIYLFIKLKIDIVLLNDTHLNNFNSFMIPHYHIYRTDRSSAGTTKCCGTAILVYRKITQNHIHKHTNSFKSIPLSMVT